MLRSVLKSLTLAFLLILGLAFLLRSPQLPVQAASPAPSALSPAGPAGFPNLPWTPPSPAYTITVKADGLYALDFNALQSAGLPVGSDPGHLDPRTLRMFWMGREMPVQVIGEGDGVFDSGDALLFYGRSIDSLFREGTLPTNKYTGSNVYWLTYGGANGLRMVQQDGTPGAASAADPFTHTEHLETNFWYFSSLPFEHNADHWFWHWIKPIGTTPKYRTFSFNANHLASGAYTGTLTVNMMGYIDGPHHLRLYINDNLVFDDATSWSDRTAFTAHAPLPQAYLQEGSNVIKVEMLNDPGKSYDQAYVNWLDIAYYDTYVAENDVLAFGGGATSATTLRFDVSNFSTNDISLYDVSDIYDVKRIVNADINGSGPYTATFQAPADVDSRFLALTPTTWLAPDSIQQVNKLLSPYTPPNLLDSYQIDYIIITHGDFWDQAKQLAAYRAAEYNVALVDVQEIYNQFNGGMMSAESIHDFLLYTHENWQSPVPKYVLLMGDGTSDMRRYRVTSGLTYIPPYLYLADPDLGETAADNRFVTLVGDDIMPDMNIGRFSVNTPDEAQAMVDKVIAYETQCQCENWSYETLFVADDLEGGGGNFYDYSDSIAEGYADPPTNTVKYLPSAYNVNKVYLGRTCDLNNESPARECQQAITTTLNITGSLFVSYIGHATKNAWAAEYLLYPSALDTLTNGPCLPVMLEMTCYSGSFHEPSAGFESLSEASTRMPVNGAIASWAPTGFGLVTGHDLLEEGLFLALFHDGIPQLGEAVTQAKQYLLDNSSGSHDDLLDTFVLFGDPALEVKTDDVCSETPTGIPIMGFDAQMGDEGIDVAWQTVSELNMLGFNVYRRVLGPAGALPGADRFVLVNQNLIPARWPGMARGAAYSFLDNAVTPGRSYQYRLQIITLDGHSRWYSASDIVTIPLLREDPPPR
jgi:hypothetical protein